MTITATLKDLEQGPVGRAVGMGTSEDEAVVALLLSCDRFADQKRVTALGERIREVLSNWPTDSIQADFDDPDWAVVIEQ